MATTIEMTCRAFRGETKPRRHSLMVDTDGRVRVWDDIGNIYTVCHSLNVRDERRARKLAGVTA